jgi:hypothetical protein
MHNILRLLIHFILACHIIHMAFPHLRHHLLRIFISAFLKYMGWDHHQSLYFILRCFCLRPLLHRHHHLLHLGHLVEAAAITMKEVAEMVQVTRYSIDTNAKIDSIRVN